FRVGRLAFGYALPSLNSSGLCLDVFEHFDDGDGVFDVLELHRFAPAGGYVCAGGLEGGQAGADAAGTLRFSPLQGQERDVDDVAHDVGAGVVGVADAAEVDLAGAQPNRQLFADGAACIVRGVERARPVIGA